MCSSKSNSILIWNQSVLWQNISMIVNRFSALIPNLFCNLYNIGYCNHSSVRFMNFVQHIDSCYCGVVAKIRKINSPKHVSFLTFSPIFRIFFWWMWKYFKRKIKLNTRTLKKNVTESFLVTDIKLAKLFLSSQWLHVMFNLLIANHKH